MIDIKACNGCEDDFYNGHNPYGVKECWMRSKGTMEPRLLIPVDLAPPYDKDDAKPIPSCYRRKRFISVKPESLDSRGYWR